MDETKVDTMTINESKDKSNDKSDNKNENKYEVVNTLDLSCPSPTDIEKLLNKNKYKNAREISQKYGEIINNKKLTVFDLLQNLQNSESDLIATFKVKLKCLWNVVEIAKFLMLLIELIHEKNPEIVKISQFQQETNAAQMERNERKFAIQEREFASTERKYCAKQRTSDRLTHYMSAYETISLTSALVFAFGVTLASQYLSIDDFRHNSMLYTFHLAITISIIFSLHALIITSWVNYNLYRGLASGRVSGVEKYLPMTYTLRNEARATFVGSLISFALSLCVLYYNALPIVMAVLNSVVFIVGIVIIAVRVFNAPKIEHMGRNEFVNDDLDGDTKLFRVDSLISHMTPLKQ